MNIKEEFNSALDALKNSGEYLYYYRKSNEYCKIRDKLQKYLDTLNTYKSVIVTNVSEFKSVSDLHCDFYGQVCRDYLDRSSEMHTELEGLVNELEAQCSIIEDRIEKANSVAQNYIDTYKGMENNL